MHFLQASGVTGRELVSVHQDLEGASVELSMERVLVAVPQSFGGAPGVAVGVHIEKTKQVIIGNLLGKRLTSGGIINIPLLPESCHHQMIFDDKRNNLSFALVDLQAFKDGEGNGDPALGMAFDAFGLADVVEQ